MKHMTLACFMASPQSFIDVQAGCSAQASGLLGKDCGPVEMGMIIQFCATVKGSIKPADNIMEIRFMTI